jgi:NitT/TauT family transport system substrate-binding protein
MTISRRKLLAGAAGIALAAPAIGHAQDRVVKVAGLRTILTVTPHFYPRFAIPGYRVEVVLFEGPADCKNAVVTGSVDFGLTGTAAVLLGGAAGEPVTMIAAGGNRGMAVIAKQDLPIASLKDLQGRKVAILPGTTQEVFILERLRMEGMSIKDLSPVRVPFGEMHAALVRGDVDAYVGTEPGVGLSLATGAGKLVEYPYSTPMGTLNVVTCTNAAIIADQPDLVRGFLRMHRQASDYAQSHPAETIQMSIDKFGVKREALERAMPNVELTWRMDAAMIEHVKIYAQHMLELKQIRALPDFARVLEPRFNDEIAAS